MHSLKKKRGQLKPNIKGSIPPIPGSQMGSPEASVPVTCVYVQNVLEIPTY